MSKAREMLNKKAEEICSKLGSAYLQKKQVDEQIKTLESMLSALNVLAPDLVTLDDKPAEPEIVS